ncbi:MAG: DUF4349 domain-containing protein [Lachnospiraceae bacterium]|nr:DUF4349 domain-containing protein [Lachnospiraceae bacterium]
MKNCREKKFLWLVAALTGAMLLAGCGESSAPSSNSFKATSDSAATADYYEGEAAYEDYDYGYSTSTASESSGSTSASSASDPVQTVDTSRKLIRTVNLDAETKAFDDMLALVDAKVRELGGYVESSNIYNGSRYNGYHQVRNGSMTIRIPSQNMDQFLNAVSEAANITNKSENVQDITLTYVDTKSQKEAYQVEYDRLLELLEEAYDLNDILIIEDRLREVRYHLESLESQLRSYDNKVDYGTVYLNIDEVEELTPVIVEEPTAWERIRDGFTDNLLDVLDGLKDFIIDILVNLPYLILWAVIILVIIVICRKIFGEKAREKRQAKKQAKLQAQYAARQAKAQEAAFPAGKPGQTETPVSPAPSAEVKQDDTTYSNK